MNSRRIHEPYLLQNDAAIGLESPVALLWFFDPDSTAITLTSLRYDERAMSFMLGRQHLDLAPTQFRLMFHLYQHAGNVCTRKSCAEAIWGHDYNPGVDAGALDEAISKLRRTLRQVDPTRELIKSRRGVGYELAL